MLHLTLALKASMFDWTDDDYTGRGVFFWTLTFHDKFHWSNRAISSSKSQKIQLPRSPLFTSDVIKVEAITWSWL